MGNGITRNDDEIYGGIISKLIKSKNPKIYVLGFFLSQFS